MATGFLRNSMINEEGGVDPEQFRMEAKFDRMDAIGKGDTRPHHPVRAVPQSQVRSAKAGRILPHDGVYKSMHEAEVAVYTPQEQMKRTEIVRANARDRRHAREAHARLEAADGGLGRTGQNESTRVDCGARGGRCHVHRRRGFLPLKDGSFLAQGYAPTRHKVKIAIR